MSADGGQTWVNLGKGTADGKNAVFSDIDTSDPDKIIFILSDGTKLTIPQQSELSISFDTSELPLEIKPMTSYNVGYVIEGDIKGLKIEIISSGNVKAKLNNRNSAKGSITITTGETVEEYDKVILIASNGNTSIMSSFTCFEGMERIFPDDVFRSYVVDNFDTDKNGIISETEALKVTSIYVSGTRENPGEIKSLEGIQYFKNLEVLDCASNELVSLDLSNNTKLRYL